MAHQYSPQSKNQPIENKIFLHALHVYAFSTFLLNEYISISNGKDKVVPVHQLIEYHGVWGSGDIVPVFLTSAVEKAEW
jgi:hypothetical protein